MATETPIATPPDLTTVAGCQAEVGRLELLIDQEMREHERKFGYLQGALTVVRTLLTQLKRPE